MLNVKLIASTAINPVAFDTLPPHYDCRISSPEYLCEFAGRACYQSWDRPNPETAKTEDYVRKNILGKGHESVLEHATATFYITGVSRSLTHELIRHRHLSFSELSQRYVDVESAQMVCPPLVREGMGLASPEYSAEAREQHFQSQEVWEDVREAYGDLSEELDELFPDAPRKQKREAARAVMPNATETRIVVTGNMRAWRHVVKLRGSLHADAEIRELAVELYRQLSELAPSIFSDMEIRVSDDGREYINPCSLTPAQEDEHRPIREQSCGGLGLTG